MILAFADNVDRATEFTQKQLEYAATVSFPAYALVYLASAVLLLVVLHVVCFVRPDAKNRRDTNTKMADTTERLSLAFAVISQLLEQHEAWHRSHDARLSRWEAEKLRVNCPLLDQSNDQPMPVTTKVTPIPHGV